MKKQILCEKCGGKCSVTYTSDQGKPKFCPFCGVNTLEPQLKDEYDEEAITEAFFEMADQVNKELMDEYEKFGEKSRFGKLKKAFKEYKDTVNTEKKND